jgi:flagellar biosynthetic protein FliR
MLTLSSADLEAMLALFLFPFARIMAWLSLDPLLGNKATPMSARVALAMVLTVAVAPSLPAMMPVSLASGEGMLILAQQIAIGVALGFTLRIVIAMVEYVGQLISLQMGLSFATLFDPINGAQTPVVSQFLVVATLLILFAINGHHLVILALARGFEEIPIGASLSAGGFAIIVNWAVTLFSTGLHIALPITAALLATNLTIGMMTRAAPQLNIFAIGFPLSIGVGFGVLYLSLAYLPAQIEAAWLGALENGLRAMRAIAGW